MGLDLWKKEQRFLFPRLIRKGVHSVCGEILESRWRKEGLMEDFLLNHVGVCLPKRCIISGGVKRKTRDHSCQMFLHLSTIIINLIAGSGYPVLIKINDQLIILTNFNYYFCLEKSVSPYTLLISFCTSPNIFKSYCTLLPTL